MLDAMHIIHDLRSRDSKYIREDGIQRFWRKANILLASWNAYIQNGVGLDSISACNKKITN